MAHQVLDLNHIHARVCEPGAERVPQVMEVEVGDPRRAAGRLERLSQLDKTCARLAVGEHVLARPARPAHLEKEWDARLQTTIEHRRLKRKVSYKRLIRLERYKLVKHLMNNEPYVGFRAWW